MRPRKNTAGTATGTSPCLDNRSRILGPFQPVQAGSRTDISSFRARVGHLAERSSLERLSFDEGVRLFQTRDFLGLGRLANHAREGRHGNLAFYNVNRYLNPTNLCWVDCALCAWAKKVNEPGGYEMAIDECVAEAGKGYSEAVTEFTSSAASTHRPCT